MKHQTATLDGSNLDYAVALALGYKPIDQEHYRSCPWMKQTEDAWGGMIYPSHISPSTEWKYGGPLIDHYWKSISAELVKQFGANWYLSAVVVSDFLRTMMRCLVAYEIGDEVEIP